MAAGSLAVWQSGSLAGLACCLALACLLLMCLSTLPPSMQCRGKREEAAEAHARFLSREGDHLTLLAVYQAYTAVSRRGHERATWCRAHFVNPRAMRKAVDIHEQVWF